MLNLKQVNEDDEDGYTGTSEDLSGYENINIGKLEDRFKDTEMYVIIKQAAQSCGMTDSEISPHIDALGNRDI